MTDGRDGLDGKKGADAAKGYVGKVAQMEEMELMGEKVAQGQYVVSDTRCPALSDCEL